jgi:hypothetical protein
MKIPDGDQLSVQDASSNGLVCRTPSSCTSLVVTVLKSARPEEEPNTVWLFQKDSHPFTIRDISIRESENREL